MPNWQALGVFFSPALPTEVTSNLIGTYSIVYRVLQFPKKVSVVVNTVLEVELFQRLIGLQWHPSRSMKIDDFHHLCKGSEDHS